MEGILIRNYRAEDRESVRKICCDTAFMGQPMEIFFSDREILADTLTSYYTDYEPESAFVAEFKGRVVGYLMGCKNSQRKEKIFLKKIFPKTLFHFLRKGLIFNKKNREFFLNTFKSFIKGEFTRPQIPKTYPGHLHIDIDSNFRRFGLGTRLTEIFFDYLRTNNVLGVHLSTFSEQGRNFFIKTGFNLLWEGKTSQWRYLLDRDITVSTFSKILDKK